LRKRFCRKFNFEIQAAATEDAIVLSLTAAHSFALAEVGRYLNAATVRALLVQALLDSPMFMTRWRWVAGVALALPRFRSGRKVPAQLARMEAEDLLAAVFPDQVACAENLAGEREIPDHPLVRQTVADCLHEAMDVAGLERLLAGLEAGRIRLVARDLAEPSPLALEVLAARPCAYLDDAPLEERRTQAVMARRWLAPETAAKLGRLDAEAVARVRAEAWPDAANPDELHDAVHWLGFLTADEAQAAPGWPAWLEELAGARRVVRMDRLWIAAERVAQFHALEDNDEAALVDILRGRLEGLGPMTGEALAAPLGRGHRGVGAALSALEGEGFALRGRFTPDAADEEWCDRRLLARIHRYTLNRLRAEIEPVAARDFLRFLLTWQRVTPEARMAGPAAVDAVILQLEGFEAPAGAWESEILPARIADYEPAWLDERCLAGRVAWSRLRPPSERPDGGHAPSSPLRTTPIALLLRRHAPLWTPPVGGQAAVGLPSPKRSLGFAQAGGRAQAVLDCIARRGASFFLELVDETGLLPAQVEEALGELAALGLVSSDSFAGLRALLTPSDQRRPRRRRLLEDAGRWALARHSTPACAKPELRFGEGRPAESGAEAVEYVARALLRRWGVMFSRLLEREGGWLPSWRDLLKVYRRLEARGEIRGGRFVAGFSGEQFALPEAVGLLRELRRQPGQGARVSLSAADPLNLVGILTPGAKLPAVTGNRLL
jgi:ATP-dependent Lhr-like helicase